jgi:hypothetical protein
MIKETDSPRKEPARKRAERRWRNHDVEKRFKEEIKKEQAKPKEPRLIEPADLLEGEQDRRGSLVRAQTKFAKDLRAMMEGNAKRNTLYYLITLESKRKRLLAEKLRRLKEAYPETQEG